MFPPGTKLGPYEILGAAGAGGMGEVYRARDTRLDRTVAVKVLPSSFTKDPDRLRRFEQEARAIAALDHPNILAVHDIGTHEGAAYLVTEFLDGETLRQRLAAGQIGQRKTTEYAGQIAQGLAAAHDKAIVHRDLKPENVFLTKEGRVKILDFGLAKLEIAHAAMADGITAGIQTTPGVVMGTAGYMAPEQVKGQAADHRSDIFSFGAMLYEMLSGQRAFRGDTSVETMNAILKEDPPEVTATGAVASPGLERIVRRCLEKKPEERFQSARDLAFALESLSATGPTAALRTATPRAPWQRWAAIAAVLLLVAALGIGLAVRSRPAASAMHFAIPVRGEISRLALSPDGSMLAFVSPDESSGKNLLFVQAVGAKSAMALPGTEGAMFPFWSPDGEYIAFFANGKLMKMRASGGTPQALASVSATPRGGSWGKKNVIVYSVDSGGALWRVNADGTGAAALTEKMWARSESSHRWPLFLPDGEHFLFWAGNFQKEGKNGFYLSSLSATDKKFILEAWSNPGFAQPGYLFYVDGKGQLLMQEFDSKAGSLRGEGRVVADSVGFQPALYWGTFTVSENGAVVSNPSSSTSQSVLTWYDRSGKELGTVGQAGTIYNPALSRDGQRVAVDIADAKAANVDIWIHDLKRGTATRFTFDPAEETAPVWSPDGGRIAFRSSRAGMVKPTNGLEPEHVIAKPQSERDDVLPTSWSPDGRNVLFTVFRSGTGGTHLYLVKLGEGKLVQLVASNANQANGQISPDGNWLAYASDESGVWEVYVTTFPAAQGKWQVSQGGGTEPRWRGDGKEMFYIGAKGMLTAVPIITDITFSSGQPQPLFTIQPRAPISSTDIASYDVTKDGSRFIVNRYVKPTYVQPLDIVLNVTAAEANK